MHDEIPNSLRRSGVDNRFMAAILMRKNSVQMLSCDKKELYRTGKNTFPSAHHKAHSHKNADNATYRLSTLVRDYSMRVLSKI